jgi:hypothetical protein
MSVQDESFRKASRRLEGLEGLLAEHVLAGAPDLVDRLQALQEKQVGGMGHVGGSLGSPVRVQSSAFGKSVKQLEVPLQRRTRTLGREGLLPLALGRE